MGYIEKANLITNGTTKVSDSLSVINSYDLTGLWSGASFNKQSENLDKVKKKLETEIQKCISYATSLEKLQKYQNNKEAINNLYNSLNKLPNEEEYDDKRKSYNSKISILENENFQLRESLLTNMALFASSKIGTELSLVSYETNPLKEVYNEIPLMFQTDYPEVPFGGGTVAEDGCSISCAAMVISYYTGTQITPGDLALQFGDSRLSNINNTTNAFDSYDIKWENNWKAGYNYEEVKQKIQEGYIAIFEMKPSSNFTQSRHIVLVTGITEDGRFIINDPYSKNYDKGKLKEGFEKGFTDEMIRGTDNQGWGGCWLIEPKDVYEERQLANGN